MYNELFKRIQRYAANSTYYLDTLTENDLKSFEKLNTKTAEQIPIRGLSCIYDNICKYNIKTFYKESDKNL